jgi:hypothetical protein
MCVRRVASSPPCSKRVIAFRQLTSLSTDSEPMVSGPNWSRKRVSPFGSPNPAPVKSNTPRIECLNRASVFTPAFGSSLVSQHHDWIDFLLARRAGSQQAARTTPINSTPVNEWVRQPIREIPYRKIPDPPQPILCVGRTGVNATAPRVPTLRRPAQWPTVHV